MHIKCKKDRSATSNFFPEAVVGLWLHYNRTFSTLFQVYDGFQNGYLLQNVHFMFLNKVLQNGNDPSNGFFMLNMQRRGNGRCGETPSVSNLILHWPTCQQMTGSFSEICAVYRIWFISSGSVFSDYNLAFKNRLEIFKIKSVTLSMAFKNKQCWMSLSTGFNQLWQEIITSCTHSCIASL